MPTDIMFYHMKKMMPLFFPPPISLIETFEFPTTILPFSLPISFCLTLTCPQPLPHRPPLRKSRLCRVWRKQSGGGGGLAKPLWVVAAAALNSSPLSFCIWKKESLCSSLSFCMHHLAKPHCVSFVSFPSLSPLPSTTIYFSSFSVHHLSFSHTLVPFVSILPTTLSLSVPPPCLSL